jgi:hypothetical protein
MIYKINGNRMCDALVYGAKFIIFSTNGEFALVKSESPLSEYLEEYDESSLDSLYSNPLYLQPCKDC